LLQNSALFIGQRRPKASMQEASRIAWVDCGLGVYP